MSVRRQIIISMIAMITIVSLILLFFIIFNTDRVQRSSDVLLGEVNDDIRTSVEQELLSLAQKITHFTMSLESEIEENMRNAANTVYEADRLSGFSLTLEDLEELRDRTGMSDLYLGGTDGIFTLSTEPGGAGVALFDIWEGYRMLVTGESDFMTSDLSMKVETGEIFKFALIPRADGMGIIESALEAGAVETHLQDFVDSDYGVRSMNLFDSSLLTLTENHANGAEPTYIKGESISTRFMNLWPFFDGTRDYQIILGEESAQVYYPVSDGSRVKYVLYIDLDTTGYFELRDRIDGAMNEQVEQNSLFNTISLLIVLAVLLIFAVIIVFFINRIMLNFEEQNKKLEQRSKNVMDNEILVRQHTIILLCVGVFFALVQGIQYGFFAASVIIASVCGLAAFMFLTRRIIPLNARVHIISNGSFFVAFGCSAAITSTPDMFGLFLACVIVGTLYFRKSVIIGMAIVVNATVVICILLLRIGLPEDFVFTGLWFFNNIAGLNCGIALLYAVSSIGKGLIDRITLKSQETEQLLGQVQEQNETIMSSLNYASNIQQNLLPPNSAMTQVFKDHSVIWKPRDAVGGDIYWIRQFEQGTVLCVADCTGHGTPGALLTMLVVSAMESTIRTFNCDDTAEIIAKLDRKLSDILHVEMSTANTSGDDNDDNSLHSGKHAITDIDDGCDLAVLFIANDGSVRFSSGKIPVFVCDGKEVTQYKGQRIFIGEGKLKDKDDVNITHIPANPDNKFYIASDGLFDQRGGEHGKQFGYSVFKQIILENHSEKQSVITAKVWEAFEEYRGDEVRRDDFELVAFVP